MKHYYGNSFCNVDLSVRPWKVLSSFFFAAAALLCISPFPFPRVPNSTISLCCCTVNVHIPKDKLTKEHNTFGFVEFKTEQDADYAMKIMNGVKLYGKPIRVNKVRVRFRTHSLF